MPVCLAHIDRPAVTQCKTCFKPLCSKCVIRHGRETFCSIRCIDNVMQSSGLMGRHLLHQRQARLRIAQLRVAVIFIASLILLILLLLVL